MKKYVLIFCVFFSCGSPHVINNNDDEFDVLNVFLSGWEEDNKKSLKKDSILIYYKFIAFQDTSFLNKYGSFDFNNNTNEIDPKLIDRSNLFSLYRTNRAFRDLNISEIYFEYGKRGVNIDFIAISYPVIDTNKRIGVIRIAGNAMDACFMFKFDFKAKKWVFDKKVDL